MLIAIIVLSSVTVAFIIFSVSMIIYMNRKPKIEKDSFMEKWDQIGKKVYDNTMKERKTSGRDEYIKNVAINVIYTKKGGKADVQQ